LEEALPFVIGPYTELGRYDGIADLGKNGWQPATAKEMGLPRTDWPGSNVVVRLNENSSRRSVSFACFTPSTAFVALIMTASGVLAISHAPAFMRALSHLGYPPYFSNLLGLGKLIGVCVLPAPGLTELKEWAYVAFGITVLSACYSHYNAGDGWLALEPLVCAIGLLIDPLVVPTVELLWIEMLGAIYTHVHTYRAKAVSDYLSYYRDAFRMLVVVSFIAFASRHTGTELEGELYECGPSITCREFQSRREHGLHGSWRWRSQLVSMNLGRQMA
jgi:hypothetical protein